MLAGTLIIWAMAIAMAVTTQLRDPSLHRSVAKKWWDQLRTLAVRVPLTIMAAIYVLTLLPQDQIAALLGDSSGIVGILLATAIGAAVPGGPMITFPVVVVLREHGVGDAQTVALLTSWSVTALHRVFAFELPLFGGQFVLVRLAASAVLPLIAGTGAALVWWLLD